MATQTPPNPRSQPRIVPRIPVLPVKRRPRGGDSRGSTTPIAAQSDTHAPLTLRNLWIFPSRDITFPGSRSGSDAFVTGWREMSAQVRGKGSGPECSHRVRDEHAPARLQGFLAALQEWEHATRRRMPPRRSPLQPTCESRCATPAPSVKHEINYSELLFLGGKKELIYSPAIQRAWSPLHAGVYLMSGAPVLPLPELLPGLVAVQHPPLPKSQLQLLSAPIFNPQEMICSCTGTSRELCTSWRWGWMFPGGVHHPALVRR